MQLSHYVWILPFCAFLTGYFTTRVLVGVQTIEVPELVGTTIFEAFPCLSSYKLTPRLIDQKEDTELEEGTIISQTPASGQKVKPYQPIFLVVSRKPKPIIAPNVTGQSLEQMRENITSSGLRTHSHTIKSIYPHNTCIAQIPAAGSIMKDPMLTIYISDGSPELVIWPQFVGRAYAEISEFLSLYGITPQVVHTSSLHDHILSDSCIVRDQRPLAGSIVSLEAAKLPVVQFQIS